MTSNSKDSKISPENLEGIFHSLIFLSNQAYAAGWNEIGKYIAEAINQSSNWTLNELLDNSGKEAQSDNLKFVEFLYRFCNASQFVKREIIDILQQDETNKFH